MESPDPENALYVARDQAIMNRKYPNGVGMPIAIRQALFRAHENVSSLKDIILKATTPLEISQEKQ